MRSLFIVTAALAMTASACSASDNPPAPSPITPQTATQPVIDPGLDCRQPLSGIASGDIFSDLSASAIDSYMTKAAELGAKAIRTDFRWDVVQRNEGGPFNWSPYRLIVDAAAKHGLCVQPILRATPAWAAQTTGCDNPEQCLPAKASTYQAFANSAATEFKDRIGTWEIDNETNSHPSAFNNVAHYLEILKGAYQAIKAVDSRTRVLPASTAAIGTTSPKEGFTAPDWYAALYKAGAKGYFDAANIHPYNWPLSPASNVADGNWAQILAVHRIMTANGETTKLIDLTEMGFPTFGHKPATNERLPKWAPETPVTEARQADLFDDTFKAFQSLKTDRVVGTIFLYSLFDRNTGAPDTEANFGLLHTDGTPKPAWTVVRNYFTIASK